jgi:hypothetical protein
VSTADELLKGRPSELRWGVLVEEHAVKRVDPAYRIADQGDVLRGSGSVLVCPKGNVTFQQSNVTAFAVGELAVRFKLFVAPTCIECRYP